MTERAPAADMPVDTAAESVALVVAALVPALREGPAAASALLRRLGDGATRPGRDGGWTPVRIVVHLAAVDSAIWIPRLRQLAAHEHPTWAWTEPDLGDAPDPSPDVAAEAFAAARTALLGLAGSLDDLALTSTGVHATFGELDAAGLLAEVQHHDAEHLASLAEAVAALASAARRAADG